tara:strand:+ start:723 stop:929 length:207 start_codon:yes stop_codon:yes gene_type:complete
MVKTRAMKGGCLKGLMKSKKGGCKVGKKRAKGKKTHQMPDGSIMSGAVHTKKSKLRPSNVGATPRKRY